MKSFLLFFLALLLIVVFGPIVLVLQFARKAYRRESLSKYLYTLAISLDQLGGSLLYGEEDWTISSIAYYNAFYKQKHVWFMHFINFLFQDKLHCQNSFEVEHLELNSFPD